MTAVAVYEQLAELLERELALLCALDDAALEELADLGRARAALIASLPERPASEALPTLERAARVQESSIAVLAHLRADVERELREVARGRRAAHGYQAGIPASRPSLDRRAS